MICQKTSTENYYFQHSMPWKPVRKFPRLLTRNISSTEIKAGGVSITKAHQAVPDLKNIVPKVPE